MNKTYLKTKKGTVKVTFELGADVNAQAAVVVGEFNNWDPAATPMKRKKDGTFSVTVNLERGKQYRYKYYLDGQRWANDPQADALTPNIFGTQDSVLAV
ncbi:MAG: isoamylase early set domain-containing protein [Chloroflexi bacterium]|nr:isoamylase early set domain-containing protein [Chloroflexota bacterium]